MMNSDAIRWQTTGIALPSGLDRPLMADEFSVPNDLQLAGGLLVWSWLDGQLQTRPGPGLLDQFVHLADAPAEHILRYAQRWGVLFLCEQHRLPTSHNPRPLYTAVSGQVTWCVPPRGANGTYWEFLEDWRHFARQARALLSIAVRLYQEHTGAAADWGTVYERMAQTGPPGQGDLAAERFALTLCVNEWLILGDVRPQFSWIDRHNTVPKITFGGGGLFGALAVQLALAISQTDGLVLCSACGAPYVPERRPRSDERHYCVACRDAGRPARDAARDYRGRRAKVAKATSASSRTIHTARSTRSVPKPK